MENNKLYQIAISKIVISLYFTITYAVLLGIYLDFQYFREFWSFLMVEMLKFKHFHKIL